MGAWGGWCLLLAGARLVHGLMLLVWGQPQESPSQGNGVSLAHLGCSSSKWLGTGPQPSLWEENASPALVPPARPPTGDKGGSGASPRGQPEVFCSKPWSLNTA